MRCFKAIIDAYETQGLRVTTLTLKPEFKEPNISKVKHLAFAVFKILKPNLLNAGYQLVRAGPRL